MLAALLAAGLAAAPVPSRQLAVTFDDLPGVSVVGEGDPALLAMTGRLLVALRESGASVVGFVNEGKLSSEGEVDPERVRALHLWLDAGFELGNHTYSHLDLSHTPLMAFEDDVVRGEPITTALLGEKARRLRWFRHPYLHTGRDLETKRGLERFLADRGYAIAPVTIDNADWIFARAYAGAMTGGDRAAAGRIVDAYVPYMASKFDYYERQSEALFGREIPQVLLLHANSLNADTFGALAAMLRGRGYSFIPLARALADAAYASPDAYTGAGGISWLHHWALSRGAKQLVLPGEPAVPDFVLKAAGVDGE